MNTTVWEVYSDDLCFFQIDLLNKRNTSKQKKYFHCRSRCGRLCPSQWKDTWLLFTLLLGAVPNSSWFSTYVPSGLISTLDSITVSQFVDVFFSLTNSEITLMAESEADWNNNLTTRLTKSALSYIFLINNLNIRLLIITVIIAAFYGFSSSPPGTAR